MSLTTDTFAAKFYAHTYSTQIYVLTIVAV